jgi:hypothetical protein
LLDRSARGLCAVALDEDGAMSLRAGGSIGPRSAIAENNPSRITRGATE